MLYHVRILLVEEKVPRQPSFPRAEIGLFYGAAAPPLTVYG